MSQERKHQQGCREVLPGVFQIRLPLPGKKPGPVNAYLFKGVNISLLDTGTFQTTANLRAALHELQCDFADIHQVVITHGHVDHYGAANRIIRQKDSKALVGVHPADKRRIETGAEASRKTYHRFISLMGVPLGYRLGIRLMSRVFRSMAEDCRVHFALNDGDKIQLGDYTATVIATPGHSKGSVCLYLEKENVLFSGDHILGHITPNAFVMLERDEELPRRSSQAEYYASVAKIENLSPALIFPAHGPRVDDIMGIAAGYRRSFLVRQQRILAIVAAGPKTVYQIVCGVFPELGGKRIVLDVFLAVSEVYTHLQILCSDGRVRMERERNRLFFQFQPSAR